MVGGEADHGILGDARLLQCVHQIGQRVLQLQIGRHIRLHLRGGIGIRRLCFGTVLGRHRVTPAVAAVTADGHVVGVERRTVLHIVVDILPDGVLHHLQIGVRPCAVLGELQAAALPLIVIAQIGVRLVAVVVVVDIVVVGGGVVAQSAELIAQCEGHTVVRGGVEADIAVDPCGNQAGHHCVFAARGGLSPRGLVEVAAHEALVRQAVERGCQLLADEPRGERLGREQNEILALKHAGVLVFSGGRQAAEVAGHIGHGRGGCVLGKGGKVDVHAVFAVSRRLGDGGRGVRALRRLVGHGGTGLAEDGIGDLQPHGGIEAEVGHTGVGVEAVGIGIPVRAPPRQTGRRAAQQQCHDQQEQQ